MAFGSIRGQSSSQLAKKVIRTLRHEGPVALVKKSALFTIRFSPLARLRPGWAAFHVSPMHIKKWYHKSGRPVTIVIPSYNDLPLLKKCLASIAATTDHKRVKVIVVDDYCEPTHRAKLKKLASDTVTIIHREENGGFAKAINTGMRAAKTGDVILLNSDTIAKKGWVEALQFGAYKFDPKAGIVGAKLLYKNGTIQYAGTHRNPGAPEWFDHTYRFQPGSFGPANVPQHTLAITGACMYIKRAVINKIGYLDEKFGMGFEDVDYALRAWEAGYRSLYFPVASLTHLESMTRGRTQGKREMDSLNYFWKKWGDWFDKRNVTAKNGKTKVIYVLQSTGVAGGHRNVFEHMNRLAENGFEVELFATDKAPTWMPLNVPTLSFKNYEALIEALDKEEAIKVATWWETGRAVWLASVRRGKPVFLVQDIETSYYKGDPVMQQTVLAGYRHEFTYLTISGWDKEELAKLHHDSTVVSCGIDLKVFHPVKGVHRETDVLMATGRRHYLKNFAQTLASWKAMSETRPRMWLYGVEADMADEDPKKITYFYKPTDAKINELLNAATVFAMTSRHEGFCLTVLEAMAAGAVVITTDSDGNRDFCFDGQNCLMVDHDDINGMKQKLEKLFNDEKLRAELQKGGYKTAEEYSWPHVTKKLVSFYKGVAHQK